MRCFWRFQSSTEIPSLDLAMLSRRETDSSGTDSNCGVGCELRYENEGGAAIRYEMSILGDRTMCFYAEYDSSETIEINRTSGFVTAYFNRDTEGIQRLLAVPFEWNIEVYSGTGTISEVSFKGLDSCRYLTLEFIKQKNEWRIQFYGIEG